MPERRLQEQDLVLAHLLRCLTNHRKADAAIVDKTITVLSEREIEVGDMPENFLQPSTYQLLRDIEAALVSRGTATSPRLPPPPPPPLLASPEPSRRANMRITTHVSHMSSSSSGSNGSAPDPGRNSDTNRRDTSMTGRSSNTHKSNGYKRQSGSHSPSSSSSSLSSPRHPTSLRPAGIPTRPLVQNMSTETRVLGAALVSPVYSSSGRREPRPDPDPDPDPPPPSERGEAARYEFVRLLLQELHDFVPYRQAVVAEDILARGDEDIEVGGRGCFRPAILREIGPPARPSFH